METRMWRGCLSPETDNWPSEPQVFYDKEDLESMAGTTVGVSNQVWLQDSVSTRQVEWEGSVCN